MKIDLSGKRALVTGSSSGIGQATAIQLAACGARVAVTYRSNEEGGKSTVDTIEKQGGEALLCRMDVGKPKEIEEVFEAMDERWGGVDLVVSNAGMDGKRAPLWEIEEEDWLKVIEVNLKGTYLVAREALRRMVAQKDGVFLTVSSVHEIVPWGGHTAYTATKAACGMIIRSLALELADSGVRALSFAPGAIKTEINEDVWSDPDSLADLKTKIPMNRMGTVEEMAKSIAVLLSDAASYQTGTTVFADGGMSAYPSFGHGG